MKRLAAVFSYYDLQSKIGVKCMKMYKRVQKMFGWVLAASLVYGFGLLFVLLQNKEKRVK
jgi:hypothetical protein